MFIVGILTWWYGSGLLMRIAIVRERIGSTMDYFSIDLLIVTLFSPFRQISAGGVTGSLGIKWRAFVDRLVSRIIGAIARLILIIVGSVGIILTIIIGFIAIVGWAIVPLLPIIGVIVSIIGWVPSWS